MLWRGKPVDGTLSVQNNTAVFLPGRALGVLQPHQVRVTTAVADRQGYAVKRISSPDAARYSLPMVAMGSLGAVGAAWLDSGIKSGHLQKGSTGWVGIQSLTSVNTLCACPRVVANAAGGLFAAWLQTDGSRYW